MTVNCLAVPDAFFAHNDYDTALSEYRRIGYSFPGRAEGREAMFRAGITLMEQAKNTVGREEKAALYDLALEEFQKLHATPGAPLEYLGKALTYQSMGDQEEEAKCFELAYRRYPKHPLLPVLREQLIFRMMRARAMTDGPPLIFSCWSSGICQRSQPRRIVKSCKIALKGIRGPPFFIDAPPPSAAAEEEQTQLFALKLAFWLGRYYVLGEMAEELIQLPAINERLIGNALFCLLELGAWKLADAKLQELLNLHTLNELKHFGFHAELLEILLSAYKISVRSAAASFLALGEQPPGKQRERALLFLMQHALDRQDTESVHQMFKEIDREQLSEEGRLQCDAHEIWALLLEKKWALAGELLHSYPLDLLSQDSSILHFLYGCWLYPTEGKEIASAYFSGVFEVLYPRTWMLCSYFVKGKISENSGWMRASFLWERRQLYRQLALYYRCTGDEENSSIYRTKALQEVTEME